MSVFNLAEYVNRKNVDEISTHIPNFKKDTEESEFFELVEKIREIMKTDKFTESVNQELVVEEVRIMNKAIIGDEESKNVVFQHIKKILFNQNVGKVKYPTYYHSLEEGIFEEIFGMSTIKLWDKYPQSTDCILQGENLYFYEGDYPKFITKMPYKDKVTEIINGLKMRFSFLVLNESNPQIEVDTLDKKRIKIMIPPFVDEPTICIRRITVENPTITKMRELHTIPNDEDFETYFDIVVNAFLNILLSGAVKSGKTTLMKALIEKRDPKYVGLSIEDTKELYLKELFPNRLIHEFLVGKRDVKDVIKDAMRVPHHYVVYQEVRGAEADTALEAGERAARGLFLNFHIMNAKNTPLRLASKIVDEFPNRMLDREIRRIAETLDLGIIMKSTGKGNRKVLECMYEMFIEDGEEKVNYIMLYDKENDCWYFNNDFKKIDKLIKEESLSMYETFIEVTERLAKRYPMPSEIIRIESCR